MMDNSPELTSLRRLMTNRTSAECNLIENAFQFASLMHGTEQRRSGEPFITHPLAVATILADQGLDTVTVAAALLHDTVEDVPSLTFADLKGRFGPEVTRLVKGVTRLSKRRDQTPPETGDIWASDMQQLILDAAEDPRILLIKLADRLHNMRTLGSLPPRSQWKNAEETLRFFAPLAAYLGMSDVRSELMHLSLQYLDPKGFGHLCEQLAAVEVKNRLAADEMQSRLTSLLGTHPLLSQYPLSLKVISRPKSAWRVYASLKRGVKSISEIRNLLSVRVIVDVQGRNVPLSAALCYVILGEVHRCWTPLPGHFRDYLAAPKPNRYQSLHTLIVGPAGLTVEVQVRSHAQHEVSQRGVLTFWYDGQLTDPDGFNTFPWTKSLLENDWSGHEASDVLSGMQEVLGAKVMVYTPRGQRVWLPLGASVIDFAYHIHSEVGRHAMSALVDGRAVPISEKLTSGNLVEILTNPDTDVQKEWLNHTFSHQARQRITQQLRERSGAPRPQERQGYRLLETALQAQHLPVLRHLRTQLLDEAAYRLLGLRFQDDLFTAIENSEISVNTVTELIQQLSSH